MNGILSKFKETLVPESAGPRIVGLVDEQTCYLESLKEVMGGYEVLPTHH